MSSLDINPTPGEPWAPSSPAATEAGQASTHQLPLTHAQRSALQARGTPSKMIGQAALVAIALPLVLAYALIAIARIAARIPLIGWLLGLYGVILAVGIAIMAAFASPLVFAGAIPVLLITRRSKLRADLAGGIGVVSSGTFEVADRKARGTLACGEVKLSLTSKEMAQLRPALKPTGQGQTFSGTLTYAPRSRAVLLVCDSAGAALIGAQ